MRERVRLGLIRPRLDKGNIQVDPGESDYGLRGTRVILRSVKS